MKDNDSLCDEQSDMACSSKTSSVISLSNVDTLKIRSRSFRNSNRKKQWDKNVRPLGPNIAPKTYQTNANSELVRRSGSIRKKTRQTKIIILKNSEQTESKIINPLTMSNPKRGFDHDSNIFNSPGNKLMRYSQSGVKTQVNNNKVVRNKALANNFFNLSNLNKMYKDWNCNEITVFIHKNIDAFHSYLKKKPKPNELLLLVKVLVKTIGTTFRESKIEVYTHLCDKSFVEHLVLYISSTVYKRDSGNHESIFNFFCNLNLFLEDIINLLPYKVLDTLYNLLIVEVVVLNELQKQWSDFSDVAKVAVKLKEDLGVTRDRWTESGNDQKELKNWEKSTSPKDFHEISLYPTSEDLRGNNLVKENIVKGSYNDVFHYLDTQFRLLREDFIDPLRDGIRHYKSSLIFPELVEQRNFNVQIYKNIQFLNKDFDRYSHNEFTVKIDEKLSCNIKWEYSKLLLFGSLVLFSKDHFETFQLATVSDRDVEELGLHGTLKVSLIGENILGDELFTSEFVMAESSAFFEPVYQVLKTLKELPIDSFPMERYLLVHNISPTPPNYLIDKPSINIKNMYGQSFTANINDNSSWPTCLSLNMSPSQASAFKSVMKNEFSVVQGPPGTGKKYLGFKIVQTILDNFDFGSPILLVSYTNHALDQFLEGLLTVTNNILRIGDRSKNEVLNKINFRNVKKTHIKHHPTIPKLKNAMTECLSVLNSNNKLLEAISNPSGIIDIDKYKYTKFHGISFENSNDFLGWLLGHSYNFLKFMMKKYACDEASSRPKPLPACNDNELADLLVGVKGKIYYSLSLTKLEDLKSNIKKYLFQDNSDKNSLHFKKEEVINDLRQLQELIYELKRRLINKNQKSSMQIASLSKEDKWRLSGDDRWALYHNCIQQIQDYTNKDVSDQNSMHTELLRVWNECKALEDFTILDDLKPKILGLTTSGAARHHTLISLLKPPIVIVQEAAAVLETHILTALTLSCQHLILIGDYNQLKPNFSSNFLAEKYHLDVSLLERMINNGITYNTLTLQYRMKPNIASLIAPTIYPELTNHSSVELYPPVLGMRKNLFFINHNFSEINIDEIDRQSKENPHEAEFMIMLCRHLLLQGYNPSDVTILTTYYAQQVRLLTLQKLHSLLKEVKISLVDNYTGEENNIILLSLVRSNNQGQIGFLNIKNRISVALSRAKFGLYIIGNMDLLMSNSETWREINVTLKSRGAIGESLPLVCQVHPETVTEVKCGDDFKQIPSGGCNRICSRLMECGHTCNTYCHVLNLEHKNLQCQLPCNRRICREPNHSCPLQCCETCLPCEVMVKRILRKCNHEVDLQCNANIENYQCLVEVEKTLPCGHTLKVPCFQDPDSVPCSRNCKKLLSCGHLCQRNCQDLCGGCIIQVEKILPCGHILKMPCFLQNSNFICPRICGKALPCGHSCQRKCIEPCGGCTEVVDKMLPCGHTTMVPCFQDHSKIQCLKNCGKLLPCGHKCQRKCHQLCAECIEKVEKTLPCSHVLKIPCFQDPGSVLCRRICGKVLPCGHICKRKCHDLCGSCSEKVEKMLPCGHTLKLPCYQDPDSVQCFRNCEKILSCGHRCQRNCQDLCGRCIIQVDKILPCTHILKMPCFQDIGSVLCPRICGKVLPCGHICQRKCHDPCGGCTEECNETSSTEIGTGDSCWQCSIM